MSIALVNARVLQHDVLVEGLAVVIDAGRIVEVVPRERASASAMHDLRGAILAPGFIDCQVNGGGGVLFNDAPTVQTIRRIAVTHRRFGTTGLLPTLISDTPCALRAGIDAVAQARAERVPGVLGIHLEGPFLSSRRHGIHDAAMLRMPDAEDLRQLQRRDAGVVMATLAPEVVGCDMIASLAAQGVVVCAGHSAADYTLTRAALDAGLRGFTHLFNAMPPMLARDPGMLGAALDDARGWCGIIVDGHHVHPATLRVALAAKARGKMVLVTDAMSPVGTALAQFQLNGVPITCRAGLCTDASGTLAGSALDMASAVRNCVALLGVALPEALRMASEYPAAWLRIDAERGRIAAGHAADLVALDDALRVVATWIAGEREDVA